MGFIKEGRRGAAFILIAMMIFASLVFSSATAVVNAAGPTSGENMPEYRVISYVTAWSWPGTYDPLTDTAQCDVDPYRVTHINYAFGHIVNAQGNTPFLNGNQNASQFPGTIDIPDPGKLRALVDLKKENPNLKILLSIGGWGMDGFCPIVHDPVKRATFVKSCVEICKQYGLDGIDLDYEYPGTSADQYDRLSCDHDPAAAGAMTMSDDGGNPGEADGNDYFQLLADFRANNEFGRNYLLTIASGIGYDWNVTVNIARYPEHLDYINCMVYDIYGEWRNHSEFNANLYPGGSISNDTEEGGGKYLSYDLAINRIHLRGYPKDIINVGIPMYGRDRNYRASTAANGRRNSTATGGTIVATAAAKGDASWLVLNQIMELYNANQDTDSETLKDVLSFEDIAIDPSTNKTFGMMNTGAAAPSDNAIAGKGGVQTTIGGYTREEAAEVELEFVSNTVKRVWNPGPHASLANGDLTVRVKSSPKTGDVGKEITRRYSVTYDDVEDVVAKTEWIQELGFGGAMYWEYSQDAISRGYNQGSGIPFDGLVTETIYKGLNGERTTVEQPARGNGDSPKTLTYGRKANPPVISYRYDKSLDPKTNSIAYWDSREAMHRGLGAAKDPETGENLGYNSKVRYFQGKTYANIDGYTWQAGFYGVVPALAPLYALDSTYDPANDAAGGNGYTWMLARNFGPSTSNKKLWRVVGNPDGYPATQLNRTEYQIPSHEPDSSALQINSAAPNKSIVPLGSTVSYDINVTGGSGDYTSVTHQVWFDGIKYDNVDGYIKWEKRRTGGPYPIPTGEGAVTTINSKASGGSDAPYAGTMPKAGAVGSDGVLLTREGEKRDRITPYPETGVGNITFSTEIPGTYYILTQVTDSSGRVSAQFSQPVEVTDDEIIDFNLSASHDAGERVNVGTDVTATATATGEDAIGVTYKFEVLKGNTIVASRDYASSNTYVYEADAEGTYRIRVIAKNSSGYEISSTTASFIVVQPLIITNVTKSGTSAEITAIGGTGGYIYSLYIMKDGQVYYSSAYTKSNTFTYSIAESGTYQVRAYCQDSSGTRVVNASTLIV